MPTETFFNLPPEKRQRVVDAALAEFGEHGYAEASISRMVQRAEIAKGSFYHYFKSKIDLFEWLVFEELGRQKTAFMQSQPAPPPGSDFFTTLESLTFAGYRWALDHPRFARIAEAMWWPSSDPDLRLLAERGRRMNQHAMSSLLRAGQAAGQVRAEIDLDIAAAVLTATLQQGADRAIWQRYGFDFIGLMQQPERAREVRDDDLRALVAGVVDVLRRGLGSPGGEWSSDLVDVEQISRDVFRSDE